MKKEKKGRERKKREANSLYTLLMIILAVLLLVAIYYFSFGKLSGRVVFVAEGVCTCNSCSDCNSALKNSSCSNIILANSIASSSQSYCLSSFSNKILNCEGYSIYYGLTGRGGGGIKLGMSDKNNTIKNCTITKFNFGIYLDGSDSNTITNTIFSVNMHGLYLSGYANFNNITNSSFFNNTDSGIYINGRNDNNLIKNNNITFNSKYGLYVSSSLYRNSTVESNEICANALGDVLLGAYYQTAGFLGNACGNTNTEICAYPCITAREACECNSCQDCIAKLSDPLCKEVRLTRSIVSTGSSCITGTFAGKIFDCQENTISRISRFGTGISISNRNTIKNCVISNFSDAIVVLGGSNIITDNVLFNNTNGITLAGGWNNITNNAIVNNGMYGINLGGSYHKILNNEISGNARAGIFNLAAGSIANVFSDNTICDNGIIGNQNDYDINTGNKGSNINTYTRNKCWTSSPENICEPCEPCEGNLCSTCEECSEKLSSRSACSLVSLDADIDNAVSPTGKTICVTIYGNNKIFDLNSNKISAGSFSFNYNQQPAGIWVSAAKNVTIENGEVSGFSGGGYGIKAGDLYSGNKEKITIKNMILNNNNIGLYVKKAREVYVSGIEADNNSIGISAEELFYDTSIPGSVQLEKMNRFYDINIINSMGVAGIYLYNVTYGWLENIVSSDNTNSNGIFVYKSKQSTFKNTDAIGNKQDGFNIGASTAIMIRDSEIQNNERYGLSFDSSSRGNMIYNLNICGNKGYDTYFSYGRFSSNGSITCTTFASWNVCNNKCPATDTGSGSVSAQSTCEEDDRRCYGRFNQTCSDSDDDGVFSWEGSIACPAGRNCNISSGRCINDFCDRDEIKDGTDCLACNSQGTAFIANNSLCFDGEVCNSLGECVETALCEDDCSSFGYECGRWSICGNITNCGSCSIGNACSDGFCVEVAGEFEDEELTELSEGNFSIECADNSECFAGEKCLAGECISQQEDDEEEADEDEEESEPEAGFCGDEKCDEDEDKENCPDDCKGRGLWVWLIVGLIVIVAVVVVAVVLLSKKKNVGSNIEVRGLE